MTDQLTTPTVTDQPAPAEFGLAVEKSQPTCNIARQFGQLLAAELRDNPRFYFFSPDETASNRLDEVYKVSERLWALPAKEWDLPESTTGRIVELLSENTLFAAMVGHLMNGEPAVLASYEAFTSILFSQILQQIKFFNQSGRVEWRPHYPAVNLLSTSMCWRQDHNGYSHQSPALISALLAVPSKKVNCFFPADDIAATAVWEFMKKSRNVVNLTTFDKNDNPRWIDEGHAKFLVEGGGASVFGFASDFDPELILAAAGDAATREALAAIQLLRDHNLGHRLRFVNINSLVYGAIGTTDHQLTKAEFADRFTDHAPILANFHGYPATLDQILRNYAGNRVIKTHGFLEEGSTTTPFEMLAMNHASRYDLAISVAEHFSRPDLVALFRQRLRDNHNHALAEGCDIIEE